MDNIFQKYVKVICSKCKNRQLCQEELRIRIDNTIKCENYKEN